MDCDDAFEDELVDRNAKGDVVEVEVVGADVVRENASAHSYLKYVCCISYFFNLNWISA